MQGRVPPIGDKERRQEHPGGRGRSGGFAGVGDVLADERGLDLILSRAYEDIER